MATHSNLDLKVIGKVSDRLGVEQHTLRYWESKFEQISPVIRNRRRYYRPEDIELLQVIRDLCIKQGYTLKKVSRIIQQNGACHAKSLIAESATSTAPSHQQQADQVMAPLAGEDCRTLNMQDLDSFCLAVNSSGLGIKIDLEEKRHRMLNAAQKEALQSLLHRLNEIRDRMKG